MATSPEISTSQEIVIVPEVKVDSEKELALRLVEADSFVESLPVGGFSREDREVMLEASKDDAREEGASEEEIYEADRTGWLAAISLPSEALRDFTSLR